MTRAQLGRPVGASGEETRQRIIVATMRCVAEVGYSRATIREIARTAQVTSASLYNYFPNKSDLIRAAIAARTDVALPRLRRAAGLPGGVMDRIEAVLDESGRLMREYPDLAAFEWAIRAETAIALDSEVAGSTGFQAFREIIGSQRRGGGQKSRGDRHRRQRGAGCSGARGDRRTRDGVSAHAAMDGAQRRPALQRNRIGAIPAQSAGGAPHPLADMEIPARQHGDFCQ